MKSIGDMPAFACEADGGCGPWPGMTYRQWLIGQVINGVCARGDYIVDSIEVADQIISQLDEESEAKETPDKSEPVSERKPLLLAEDGLPVYLVLNKDGHLDSLSALPTATRLVAEKYGGTAVPVFVDGGISILGGETIDVDYEWGVYKTLGDFWVTIQRFPTKADAATYIAEYEIRNAIPFPVPKLEGGR